MKKPLLVIVMGSQADLEHCQKISNAAATYGLESVLHVASAHKTPNHTLKLLLQYEADPRPKVYVTVAGRSNALSGFTDGSVASPVIACPPPSDAYGGADIYSSLRMPSGIAPAVVLDPANAALLAAKILGLVDANIHAAVKHAQKQQVEKILQADIALNPEKANIRIGKQSLTEDSPHEECGVIGIFAPHEDVARMAFFGLFALQHRGQEAAGIAVSDGETVRLHKDTGLVSRVFTPENLAPLHGNFAIGHTRYSTTGASTARNAQPFLIETRHGPVALAHNGNLVNAAELRQELLETGVGLSTSSDTEVMTMMLAAAAGRTWNERLKNTMTRWHGAYSLVVLTLEGVLAVRDPWGFRPLSVGLLPSGGWAAASESGALRTLGCEAIREVLPGEIIALSNTALSVQQALPPAPTLARCVFEHIYFSRPDSFWDGQSVHTVRQNLGRALAREAADLPGRDAEVVIPVPDSSTPAAIGYAAESGIPYNECFIKNRYIGRTFIQPTDSLRKQGVALKFNVVAENVLNRRVIMVDDSIVRGNTTGPLVRMLRDAGASEVHVRITCPPIIHPCHMGVDMGTYRELIAANLDEEAMRRQFGCDSLYFLSLEGMMQAIGRETGYCQACFTGRYPIAVESMQSKTAFETSIA